MNYDISLQAMNALGKEILSKQPAITLAKAKAQAERINNQGSQKNKKLSYL